MSVELILEKKLSYLSRTFIAIFIAVLIFYLGLYKLKKPITYAVLAARL